MSREPVTKHYELATTGRFETGKGGDLRNHEEHSHMSSGGSHKHVHDHHDHHGHSDMHEHHPKHHRGGHVHNDHHEHHEHAPHKGGHSGGRDAHSSEVGTAGGKRSNY